MENGVGRQRRARAERVDFRGVTREVRHASPSVHCLVRNSKALAVALGVAALAGRPGAAWSQNAELAGSSSRVTDMREMAMFHNSNVFVWIRATDAGTVLVYASADYRNAFAQPVVISADEADHWAALAEPLTADSLRIMAARRDRPDTTPTRSELAGGDILLSSRPRTDPPSLTVKVGALGPGAVTTTFLAPALGSLVPALREAANAARDMAANRAADSTARAASLAAATMPVQPPVPLASAQPEAVAATAPADAPAATAEVLPVVPPADVRAAMTLAGPGAAPAANLAQRSLASPPAIRVKAYAATETHVASPTARTTTIPVRSAPQSSTVAIVATTTPVIPPAPSAALVQPAPASAPSAPPVAHVLADSAALADGGLSDDEFATEAHRRQSSMTACFTQYGLGANPALHGRVTVRISLSDSGEVMRATVVDRSWSAAVPTEVESCIVHRVFVWHFPVARRSSIHDYTLTFGQ